MLPLVYPTLVRRDPNHEHYFWTVCLLRCSCTYCSTRLSKLSRVTAVGYYGHTECLVLGPMLECYSWAFGIVYIHDKSHYPTFYLCIYDIQLRHFLYSATHPLNLCSCCSLLQHVTFLFSVFLFSDIYLIGFFVLFVLIGFPRYSWS